MKALGFFFFLLVVSCSPVVITSGEIKSIEYNYNSKSCVRFYEKDGCYKFDKNETLGHGEAQIVKDFSGEFILQNK